MEYDLFLKNGLVVDGTGEPGYKADVLVKDGKIAGVEKSISAADNITARQVIDCDGLTVCPGFIDMHSHMDFLLPMKDHPELMKCFLEQGVTTVIGGNCGFSPAPVIPQSKYRDILSQGCDFCTQGRLKIEWDSLDSYFDRLETNGISLNLAELTGHGTLRWSLFGTDYSYPGEAGMAAMKDAVKDAFDSGSCGYSLGLGYEPGMFVEPREIEEMASFVKEQGRILTVHLRAFSKIAPGYKINPFAEDHNLQAIREMIDVADRTGVKLQISHLIFVGRKSWASVDRALEIIDKARSRGIDVGFDSFPYFCGNTTVFIAYPGWFLKDIDKNFNSSLAKMRLKFEWSLLTRVMGFGLDDIQIMWCGHPELEKYDGMFLSDIAQGLGMPLKEAYMMITRMSKGRAICLLHKYSGDDENDQVYRKVLAHQQNLVQTDAIIAFQGAQNPAAYGTFPRVIQRYHKELGVLSLEEAIAKMTGRSANRFGIKDRGTVQSGNWADLTIFDYQEIRDNNTLKKTGQRPSGIKYVFVNGQEAVRDGIAVHGMRWGKVIRV